MPSHTSIALCWPTVRAMKPTLVQRTALTVILCHHVHHSIITTYSAYCDPMPPCTSFYNHLHQRTVHTVITCHHVHHSIITTYSAYCDHMPSCTSFYNHLHQRTAHTEITCHHVHHSIITNINAQRLLRSHAIMYIIQ